MSTAVQKFHEEEAIGKTYDWQIAQRLLRYLKPYVRLLIPALLFTLTLNGLNALQPKFTQWAIDWHIVPATQAAAPAAAAFSGVLWLALVALGVRFVIFLFSYFQTVLLNSVSRVMMRPTGLRSK